MKTPLLQFAAAREAELGAHATLEAPSVQRLTLLHSTK
jgi:hypothetical protein